MPKQTKGMRGRPITLEEFERMLDSVGKGLFKPSKRELTPGQQQKLDQQRQPVFDSYRFYLHGLWASGLRLEESLTRDGKHAKPTRHVVGPRVADIGRAAGVATSQPDKMAKSSRNSPAHTTYGLTPARRLH